MFASGRRHGAGLQGARGFLGVVEVALVGADDLVVLVALAGDQDDVAGAGVGQDALDGGPAVGFLIDRGPAAGGEAGADLVDDRPGVLGARVVAGDPDVVGQGLGDGGHARALGAVAVAA